MWDASAVSRGEKRARSKAGDPRVQQLVLRG